MLEGFYRKYINGQGLRQVIRDPDLPDVHLGVGFAEDMTPQPIIITATAKQPTARAVNVQSQDDLIANGTGGKLSQSAFPASGYLGAPLGGV
jgi:hypothetical protein